MKLVLELIFRPLLPSYFSDLIMGDSGTVHLHYPLKVHAFSVAVESPCSLEESASVDWLHGEGDNDFIIAGFGPDEITAGAGHDTVLGDAGELIFDVSDTANNAVTSLTAFCTFPGIADLNGDRIDLGTGNDVAIGAQGPDMINAGTGNDLVMGDCGEIRLAYPYAISAISDAACAQAGEAGNDTVHLGDGLDACILGYGSDVAYGEGGRDYIVADDGRLYFDAIGRVEKMITDCVLLHSDVTSDDVVQGGDDNDIVLGGRGADRLFGNDGQDLIFGDNAQVVLLAGVVQYAGSMGPDDGFLPDDRCQLEGGADEVRKKKVWICC